MRSGLIDLLHSKISASALSTVTIAALQEILDETLDNDNDILRIIESAAAHLENIYAEESLIQAFWEFGNTADGRIEKIKKQSSIDSLLNNLANLNTLSPDLHTRMAVNHLADLLKAIVAAGKIEPEVASEIFNLKMR